MAPDHNANIGTALAGFIHATGFSGHGFPMSPAVGEVVRDLYRGREPFVGVSGFDARHFARTGARPERDIV
ncbi:hypothetical protein GCM10029978_049280 [Actinoallomurus acanthiterrae]